VRLMKRRLEKQWASDVKTIDLPMTPDELKGQKPFEFQNWVIQTFNGVHSARKTADMGIDGYSFLEHLPIQVKQSERVGRNVVDNFETAIRREQKHKGYIVAFSFTRGAHEEVARVKATEGIEIELVPVSRLLEDPTELVSPEAAQLWRDMLPKARPKNARPSAEQLVASDRELVAMG
jgi:Restriction endonuclease